jgi:hypothetical protein
MAVVIGVLRETASHETRVALVPEIATKLKGLERASSSRAAPASRRIFRMPLTSMPRSAMHKPFSRPPTFYSKFSLPTWTKLTL